METDVPDGLEIGLNPIRTDLTWAGFGASGQFDETQSGRYQKGPD
jgi:hypothetical protein